MTEIHSLPCAAALFPDGFPWLGLLVGLAVLIPAARIYGHLLLETLSGRGKVRTEGLGLPDLLATSVLFAWLGSAAVHGFANQAASPPMTDKAIIQSAILFGAVVGGIVWLLRVRGLSVARLFGLRPAALRPVLAQGMRLLLAALPLVFFCFVAVRLVVGEEAPQQEITQYFSKAARHGDWHRVLLAAGLAVFIAPVTEEFIFRGYFYGVLRRHLGILPALLLTSALFASIHLNGPVFLPLFVLAGCLTLAYEATGSLLTSMLMHALFNAAMLWVMFYTALHS